MSLLFLWSKAAVASCDQIPGTANTFRAALGSVNRPYASPGDFVELRLSPLCDAVSPGFDSVALNHVVTVAFTPPQGNPHLVIVADDCAALEPERDACEADLGEGAVVCLPIRAPPNSDAVEIIERESRRLRFRFPNTAGMIPGDADLTLTGPVTVAVSRVGDALPCGLAQQPCRLQAGLVACVDDLYRIDGTCNATVDDQFGHFTALPIPNDAKAVCSDPSPLCSARAAALQMTIDADGNLLVPMEWNGVILPRSEEEASRELGIARLVDAKVVVQAFPDQAVPLQVPSDAFLASYSTEGGRLAPVFDPRVDASRGGLTVFGSTDAPRSVLRIARRGPALRECRGGDRADLPCADEADCLGGTCDRAACRGGSDAGNACDVDAECRGGECGKGLFDFRPRLANGVGPIVLTRFAAGFCQVGGEECTRDDDCAASRCVSYRVAAAEPVPLEGLIESANLFVTVVPEAIDGRDLNGDGDEIDDVMLLSDRRTGVRLPIGESSSQGRASTRILDLPFEYPAVAAEDDVVAFLEPEPLQGRGDRNGDDDVVDTILRVYRTTTPLASSLLGESQLAADAAPLINGHTLVLSDGLLWFRSAEGAAAAQRIRRVSVGSDGSQGNGDSERPALALDGKTVAFASAASSLTGENPAQVSAFVHDLDRRTTHRIALDWPIVPVDASVTNPALSRDGRWVAVSASVTNGNTQIFAYDRDADGNGIFDEAGGVSTVQMNARVDAPVDVGRGSWLLPTLSPTGRWISALSTDPDVTGLPLWATQRRIAIRDRDADNDGVFDSSSNASPPFAFDRPERTRGGVLSAGTGAPGERPTTTGRSGQRFVAFTSFDKNLPISDLNNLCVNAQETTLTCRDVLLKDSLTEDVDVISVSSAGVQGNNHSFAPAMSADARFIAFQSLANNFVPGDTNEVADVFLRDRINGATSRISVGVDGAQGDNQSLDRVIAMSADGRYVAFGSEASTLVPGDDNNVCDNNNDQVSEENCNDIFVQDRLTGFARRISQADGGTDGNGHSTAAALSAEGWTIAFESQAENLVAGDDNGERDVFVVTPDDARDVTGNGRATDTVLQLFDTRAEGAAPTIVGPARATAVFERCAAFLSPEAAWDPADPTSDRNGDGDIADDVAHLFCAGQEAPVNLGRAAAAVALNADWIALLVSEAADGDRDLHNDSDRADWVLEIASRDRPTQWIATGLTGDVLAMNESVVAVLTSELGDHTDLNADGERSDQVVQLYDLAAQQHIPLGIAAEDFVLGTHLLALRASEGGQGEDLNGDGDATDAVMYVYDLDRRELVNTGQAASPCNFPSCDPQVPYRVENRMVTFLTREEEQSADLTNNGDQTQLVKQQFHLDTEPTSTATALHARVGVAATRGRVAVISAVTTGICSGSGAACASDSECGAGASCYVPPGECVRDLGLHCTLSGNPGEPVECVPGAACLPTGVPGEGTCALHEGSCRTDANCTAPARCAPARQTTNRLLAPVTTQHAAGEVVLAAGRCREDLRTVCSDDLPCAQGAVCVRSAAGSSCYLEHGTCRQDDDCAGGATCAAQLVVATAADVDRDGVADPFDNCARIANAEQDDADGNGIGDACQGVPATPTMVATPASTAQDNGCALGPMRGAPLQMAILCTVGAVLYLRRRFGV